MSKQKSPRKHWMTGLAALAIVAVATGCGTADDDAPQLDEDWEPGTEEQLIGTVWRLEEFHLTFQEPPDVVIRGEIIEQEGYDEVTGVYTVDEDGIIRVSALNESRVGTWDGENLIIDGITGEPLDE